MMSPLDLIYFEARPVDIWLMSAGVIATALGYLVARRSEARRSFVAFCIFCVVVQAIILSIWAWRYDGSWWFLAVATLTLTVFYCCLIKYFWRSDTPVPASRPLQEGMYDIYFVDGGHTPHIQLPRPISNIAYAKASGGDEYLIPFDDEWRMATHEEALSRIVGAPTRQCAGLSGCGMPAADGDIYCIDCRSLTKE